MGVFLSIYRQASLKKPAEEFGIHAGGGRLALALGHGSAVVTTEWAGQGKLVAWHVPGQEQ